MEVAAVAGPPRAMEPRWEVMLEPDEVAAMMRLHRLGWGSGAGVRVQPDDGEALRRGSCPLAWCSWRWPARAPAWAGQVSPPWQAGR